MRGLTTVVWQFLLTYEYGYGFPIPISAQECGHRTLHAQTPVVNKPERGKPY